MQAIKLSDKSEPQFCDDISFDATRKAYRIDDFLEDADAPKGGQTITLSNDDDV